MIVQDTDKNTRLLQVCREAHRAIHSNAQTVTLDGALYPVLKSFSDCRYVTWRDIKFMEQNKTKTSRYAEMARKGERITWGIRFGTWIYITDAEIGTWSDGKLNPL